MPYFFNLVDFIVFTGLKHANMHSEKQFSLGYIHNSFLKFRKFQP